jgi:fatty-acyl-CoA synthase
LPKLGSVTAATPPSAALSPADAPRVADLLLARADDTKDGLLFEDSRWSWQQHVTESAVRAAWLDAELPHDGQPRHVGVLLDNGPEFSFLLGAAALSDAVIVGLNLTRRGGQLARDVLAGDCQLIVTDSSYLPMLDGLDLGPANGRIVVLDDGSWEDRLSPYRDRPRLEPAPSDGDSLRMLIFTSGTSGEPKAVRVTDRKIAFPGIAMATRGSISRDDVSYLSMPMFHSACVMQGWAPTVASGATMAIRRKFSASGFLPDVRRYGVTYFHYVGKPLAYILATPSAPDDADNSLRVSCGNEAAPADIDRFAARFGCKVEDGFGSTEGGVSVTRTPDTPMGSIGVPGPGVTILDPVSGGPVPDAEFDENGVLLNAEEATGEIVNASGAGHFAGYYKNEQAETERMRGGMYWSGDLAYRDAKGFFYFAGRSGEWMRVDGENIGTAPIERILARYAPVSQVAVYAVPDEQVGDQVMAALVLHDGAPFDAAEFAEFLGSQDDLGTKWAPRYVRISTELPRTATNKVLKRHLAQETWHCADPVWRRPGNELSYVPLTA